eukprot:gene391-21897_t
MRAVVVAALFLHPAAIGALKPRRTIRCNVTRDTNFGLNYRGKSGRNAEQDESGGGDAALEMKDMREFVLLDFDVAAARGWTVAAASLHVRLVSPPNASLRNASSVGTLSVVDVSTVAAEWVEEVG